MAPKPPKVMSLDVIKSIAGRQAFDRIWDKWPVHRSDGNRAKGHRVEAERAFQKILEMGGATVEELEAGVALYLGTHPNVLKGYPANVATFFGFQKGIWIESVRYLRARAEASLLTVAGA
jgi:hypothetical protein